MAENERKEAQSAPEKKKKETKKRWRAIIFAFDGTIADTYDTAFDARNRALKRLGYPQKTQNLGAKYLLGIDSRGFVSNGLPPVIRTAPLVLDTMLDLFQRYYEEIYMHATAPGGMRDALVSLEAFRLSMAVMTIRKPSLAIDVLENLYGKQFRPRDVFGAKDTKSVDAIFETIAGANNIRPEQCILVSDSRQDLGVAKHLGMATIGVSWGYTAPTDMSQMEEADYVADQPSDLSGIVETILARPPRKKRRSETKREKEETKNAEKAEKRSDREKKKAAKKAAGSPAEETENKASIAVSETAEPTKETAQSADGGEL